MCGCVLLGFKKKKIYIYSGTHAGEDTEGTETKSLFTINPPKMMVTVQAGLWF